MRRSLRFFPGVAAGGTVLAGYVYAVGAGTVLSRATAVAPWAFAAVVALVVAEGVADAVGVWASIRPLGDGISLPRSVQFALAGDFFDVLSPAGPVTSEPIMARFVSVATGTGYADALGVRSVAKYVKAGAQLTLSGAVGLLVLFGTPDTTRVLTTIGLSVAGLLAVGCLAVLARRRISRALVPVLTPLVTWLSGLYRTDPHDRSVVREAVGRYWGRVVAFRDAPELLVLVAAGGLLEQVLTATALWVALAGVDATAPFLPILVAVPLPQVASVVPVPGSLGAYDLLVAGVLVLVTGTAAATATAAVLVVRTVTIPFSATAGGLCAALLRGWRPTG